MTWWTFKSGGVLELDWGIELQVTWGSTTALWMNDQGDLIRAVVVGLA